MKKFIMAAMIIGLPSMAAANRYNNINYGQVVEVDPIYQVVSIPQERQVCDSRYGAKRRTNTGSVILGGIIGGAIGNKFGRGHGRDASTALGILIGAGVGANKSNRSRHRNTCYIETYYHEEERFMGYDVTYRFNGELYHTQMQEHPGDRVRLRVAVDVID
ncbi:MAG: glycine zipper 2TM domain-containing protein [Marinicella sp.]